MISFKEFLIEGRKKAIRRGDMESLTKEAMRSGARQANVSIQGDNLQRELNIATDSKQSPEVIAEIENELTSTRERERNFNINTGFLAARAGERGTVRKPAKKPPTIGQIAKMLAIELMAKRGFNKGFAHEYANQIIDRQPVIKNKDLQDKARQYEIETRTKKVTPLFGGKHKLYIHKYG